MSTVASQKLGNARRRSANQIVEKSIDRVYNEVANLDGDGLMDVTELYVAVLLVFNDLNKFVPGGHINPPKRKVVEGLLKSFDLNLDGKLSRAEFEELVRKTMPGLVKRIILHVAIYCSVVPILVWATKASVSQVSESVGNSIPGGLLATVYTIILKVSGVLRN